MQFRQSSVDFPLMVRLGEKVPTWGLSRWAGNGGLRFIPSDDEGFAVRGDRRQLLYKGRRRSHRFTILGDGAFEYDCILNREPESNVVALRMEGAERFDFFRQPDFVRDPFLKGSYAVYKKETLIGEGTGKLCHIHRPLVVDALGRRVWGDLAVVGNELRITIPEQWLAEAVYPVVVDPTVGTTTVGSQWEDFNAYNPWHPDEHFELVVNFQIAVNQYFLTEDVHGIAHCYFYCDSPFCYNTYPVLYNGYDEPYIKVSSQEMQLPLYVQGNVAGWNSATFHANTDIDADGNQVWFGMYTYELFIRYDFGAVCYMPFFYTTPNSNAMPLLFPPIEWYDIYDYKISMYFTYGANNYTRTLTQGVSLNESRKVALGYRRTAIQTVKGSTTLTRFETFLRKAIENVANSMSLTRLPLFMRAVSAQAGILDTKSHHRELSRECNETAELTANLMRRQVVCRVLIAHLNGTDKTAFQGIFIRLVQETQSITEAVKGWVSFFRGLYDESGSIAETMRKEQFYRTESDTVQAEGSVFRGLLIFARILTTSFVRDFVLSRFLVAREELVLKSCITREVILESRIN